MKMFLLGLLCGVLLGFSVARNYQEALAGKDDDVGKCLYYNSDYTHKWRECP